MVTENGHIWQLHQYCENGLQIENKSQEILHHLGTQKDAKLFLKCTKIRLAAGLRPDPLGVLNGEQDLEVTNGPFGTSEERRCNVSTKTTNKSL